jgi:hypothetical protein
MHPQVKYESIQEGDLVVPDTFLSIECCLNGLYTRFLIDELRKSRSRHCHTKCQEPEGDIDSGIFNLTKKVESHHALDSIPTNQSPT